MKTKLILASAMLLSASSFAFERTCTTGSGFYTSSVTFHPGGAASCRVGDSNFGSGTWSQSGFNVFVRCDNMSENFVTNSTGSALTSSTGRVFHCEIN